MKRLICACLLTLLCLLPCAAMPEEPGVPAEITEAVERILQCDWVLRDVTPEIGKASEADTYWTVTLRSRETGETAAVMRINDLDDHALLYYRLADVELPRWLPEKQMIGLEQSAEEWNRWTDLERQWRGWADSMMSIEMKELSDGAENRKPDLFPTPEPGVGVFVKNLDNHGSLLSALLVRWPEEEDGTPQVLAYVDVRSNPASGYDGYMTGAEAQAMCREAVREAFGAETAECLRTEWQGFIIYDRWLYLEEDEDGLYGLAWPSNPLWVVCFVDPRGEFVIDALNRNFLSLPDPPEGFGYG